MGNQFFLHRQRNPIPHHIVYNQIKEGEQDDTYLGCPSIHLEVGAVVPIFTGNDLFLLLRFCQEPAHVCPRAVALKCCQ